MTGNKIEQEVKFYLNHPRYLEERLSSLGAALIQPRTYELNLRFDTADRRLSNSFQVLRLRQDQKCLLTYKGPGDPSQPVSAREEIEVEISDLQTARQILEALGYKVIVTYEKYRTVYQRGALEISLDEMPFGNFCEIEGPDAESIRLAAEKLNLNWDARSKLSYLTLFSSLKEKYGLSADDLTFAEFKGKSITAKNLGLETAD